MAAFCSRLSAIPMPAKSGTTTKHSRAECLARCKGLVKGKHTNNESVGDKRPENGDMCPHMGYSRDQERLSKLPRVAQKPAFADNVSHHMQCLVWTDVLGVPLVFSMPKSASSRAHDVLFAFVPAIRKTVMEWKQETKKQWPKAPTVGV